MPKEKVPVRPYWTTFHEHEASKKEYHDAVTMLLSTVQTAVMLADTPEKAMHLMAELKQYSDRLQKAAYGDD